MELKHILGRTYCLMGQTVAVPFYMLDDRRIVLLDSGQDSGAERDSLISLLEPYGVTAIIATHAHPDHVGANVYYQQRGAKIYMPSFEAEALENPQNLKAWYGLFSIGEIKRMFSHILFKTDHYILPEDREVVIEGHSFAITPAPGHTMDQICVTTPDGVFYAADALLSEADCRHVKIPYCFSIPLDQESRQNLRSLEPKAVILAHGGPAEDLHKLIDLNHQCYEDRAQRILDLVTCPMTLEDILAAAVDSFHLRPNANIFVFRIYERNVRAFVDYLVDRGDLTPEAMNGRLYYKREQ